MIKLVKIYTKSPSGQNVLQCEYYQSLKTGHKHGQYIEYYPKGTKKMVANYSNDMLHDKCEFYDESEKMTSELMYFKGILNGEQKEYYPNYYLFRRIKKTTNYLMGVKQGICVTYYYSGNVRMIEHYTNGKLNGKRTEYYDLPHKLIFRTSYLKNDKLHGELIQYSHHQNPEFIANYRNDKLHGKYTVYSHDNKIIIETNYFKGLKYGAEIFYENNKVKHIDNHIIEIHGFYTTHYDTNGKKYRINRVFEYNPNDLLPTHFENSELQCDGTIDLVSKLQNTYELSSILSLLSSLTGMTKVSKI